METHVTEGKLICGNCGHEYMIKDGIANFLLPSHLGLSLLECCFIDMLTFDSLIASYTIDLNLHGNDLELRNQSYLQWLPATVDLAGYGCQFALSIQYQLDQA